MNEVLEKLRFAVFEFVLVPAKTISMGGVSGWVEFAGEVDEFIPFFKIAEYLHIGKGTGLGPGKIGVEVLR